MQDIENKAKITLPKELLEPNTLDSRWSQGPFANFQQMKPRTVGSRYEKIAKLILEKRGVNITKAINAD